MLSTYTGHMSSGEEAQAGLYAPYGGGRGARRKAHWSWTHRSTVSWVRGCLSGSKTENVYCIAMNIFVYLCLCMMQLYVLYLVSSWLIKLRNMSSCLTCPNQERCYTATINLFVYAKTAVHVISCNVVSASKIMFDVYFVNFGPMRFRG